METLQHSLRQSLAGNISPALQGHDALFLAFLGWLTDVTITEPRIVDVRVTSEGWLIYGEEGDIGYPHFARGITDADFRARLNDLCDALYVPDSERAAILACVPQRPE
jgi:hypothetical protein